MGLDTLLPDAPVRPRCSIGNALTMGCERQLMALDKRIELARLPDGTGGSPKPSFATVLKLVIQS